MIWLIIGVFFAYVFVGCLFYRIMVWLFPHDDKEFFVAMSTIWPFFMLVECLSAIVAAVYYIVCEVTDPVFSLLEKFRKQRNK